MNEMLTLLTGVKVDNPRSIIEQGFIGNDPTTASCLIKTINVNSLSQGTVLAVERSPISSNLCVTVEVNSQRWVRYCELASTKLVAGQLIHKGDFVGYGYKGKMRLEYCTSEINTLPVRVLGRQLYKHDPTPIIFTKRDISEVS